MARERQEPGRKVRRGGSDDAGFRFWTAAFALILFLLAAGIGFELWRHSRLPIQKFGWKFWVTSNWDPVAGDFGALPFIWGTLYSSLLGLFLSTPIALGIAIFVNEIVPSAFRQPLAFLTELLAAIPSIVYGLWGVFVLVPIVRRLEVVISKTALARLPLFSGPPFGVGMLTAGLILAIMVIPFISAISREVLKAVPLAQREAAYALGATKWEAIKVALRYGRSGLLGAIMLGFGRAFGETMAVTMVIGNNPQVSLSLFAPQHTMAAVLANEFTEAATDLYLQALIEIGLVLFVITLVINVLSRLLIWSTTREAPRVPERVPLPEPVVEAA
jgi:phosphate transport system permease protein